MSQQPFPPRRVYVLDPRQRDLSEEEIAVVFAMTSRMPDPFDAMAERVTAERAAQFHERWVVGYGHASVAEHAVLHIAVESVSRLAADTLEDNRLASYTEKSSRYQVIDAGHYHVPSDLDERPDLRRRYVETCDALFDAYGRLVDGVQAHLRGLMPREARETERGYATRLRRAAVDHCRFALPAATLTNVGVTVNARLLEHAISKLMSSTLAEERDLGADLKQRAGEVTPTLVKYADPNAYLRQTRAAQWGESAGLRGQEAKEGISARLVQYDADAEERIVAALLYRFGSAPYDEALRAARSLGTGERSDGVRSDGVRSDGVRSDGVRSDVLRRALEHLGPHDNPTRELEWAGYTFDLVMDYGAYREFKRHRMQSYIGQPLSALHGYLVPPLVRDAGMEPVFHDAMARSEDGYRAVAAWRPDVAQYLATHAHYRRVLCRLNLREAYHLFRLRTSEQAHFSLRRLVARMYVEIERVHPALLQHVAPLLRVKREQIAAEAALE